MQIPGYLVAFDQETVTIQRATFDETELDPATAWTQIWENQDAEGKVKGFTDLKQALCHIERLLRGE